MTPGKLKEIQLTKENSMKISVLTNLPWRMCVSKLNMKTHTHTTWEKWKTLLFPVTFSERDVLICKTSHIKVNNYQ